MLDENTEKNLKNRINTFIVEKDYKHKSQKFEYIGNIQINEESFEQIIVQFYALHLIERSNKKHTASDNNKYWSLTEYGERTTMQLRAIKNVEYFKGDLSEHERDVLISFQRFIKMCAARVGQLLNLSSLSDDCGISHNTVKSWISILESSFIIYLLKPYYKNFNKRLVKMPKLYFYDTGLLCSLLSIENIDQVSRFYLKGNIFESFVISEIIKYRLNLGYEPNCYFWRDKHGKEVDCIIEKSDKIINTHVSPYTIINRTEFKGNIIWRRVNEKGL